MMFCKLAWGNVRRSARDFALYFLTIVFGVSVFYAFNSITDQQAVLALEGQSSGLLDLLGMLIGGVSVFVAVILAFLVVYADRFLIRRRKREFAVYLTLGMQRGQLARLVALETGMIGAVSLAVGIALGVGLSQLLMHVTASFFGAEVPGFAFVFSTGALAKTLVCFLAIFAVTIVSNSGVVMRARLIDLLSASKASDDMKLRSIPLSFALFVVACAVIGSSYHLLLETGLMSLSPQFYAATVLVCAGTLLFFYSLSGFLLRAVQACRPLYLRGLAMFTLRQLNARVNSTFLSMSVICMTLFLAITSVCGGIGICNTLTQNIETSTNYDATASTYWATAGEDAGDEGSLLDTPWGAYAREMDFDMARGLAESGVQVGAAPWEDMVERSVQVDYLGSTTITYGTLDALADTPLMEAASGMVSPGFEAMPLPYVSLSQYNAALELAGAEPVSLADDECMLAGDSDITLSWLRDVADAGVTLDVEGTELKVAGTVGDACIETSSIPLQSGALVVPDAALPAGLTLYRSILDVDFVDANPDAGEQFSELCAAVQDSVDERTWPLSSSLSREEVWEQNMGLTAIVGYLAVYIGFILVVASAAILAIQQLSSASDNAGRYALLSKLGASRQQVTTSVLVQVAVCFAFPLALALAHTACAFQVVADVVQAFGHLDITAAAGMTAAAFLALYGLYFALTCVGSLALARGAK